MTPHNSISLDFFARNRLAKIFPPCWVAYNVEYGAETCLFLCIHYHNHRSIIIKCLYITFFPSMVICIEKAKRRRGESTWWGAFSVLLQCCVRANKSWTCTAMRMRNAERKLAKSSFWKAYMNNHNRWPFGVTSKYVNKLIPSHGDIFAIRQSLWEVIDDRKLDLSLLLLQKRHVADNVVFKM